MTGHRPPRFFERMVQRMVPPGLWGEGTLGDMAEEFERRARVSPVKARLWYAGQAISVVWSRTTTGYGPENVVGRSQLWMDLRWSIRSIFRNPAFSLGVVAVLGLGLAANTAVFSVVSGTFANTSWWRDADRTVAVWPGREFSMGELEFYDERQAAYDMMGAYTEVAFSVGTTDGESESVNAVVISPDLFLELAVQPTLGRAFTAEDATPGGEPVVILGESLWRRSFSADPEILDRTVSVNGSPYTVVGVQGAGAKAPGGRAGMWVPLVLDQRSNDYWPIRNLNVMGLLKDGATVDQAFDDLVAHNNRLSDMFPRFYPPGFADGRTSVARADAAHRELIGTPLLLLLGGTTLLMLVTALNVGNLLLGRAIQRREELAVRTALGASKGRIVAQLLVESLVLTGLALVAGVFGGRYLGRWIADLFVGEAVVTSAGMTTPSVLAFTALLALLTVLVLSGLPIVHYLRTQRVTLTVKPASAARTQRVLVATQAALATMLLVSAVLLVATVDNLRSVPLGFESSGLVTFELSPPEDRVAGMAARGLYDRLVEQVSAIPGVEAVGLTAALPLRHQPLNYPINLQTAPVDPGQAVRVPKHRVDPGFFEALRIQPIEGRLLGTEDRGRGATAVVVNASLARMLWADGSPVGQMIAIDPHAWSRWVQVVGVIPDIRSGDITGQAGPAMYVALAESRSRDVTLVVRTSGSTKTVIPAVRNAIAEVDRLVPVRAVMSMDDVVKTAYSTSWVVMGLLIVLAVLATALGAVGIYAVLARHVAIHQKDIGIRMALGADPGSVVGSIVRSGVTLAAVGVLVGSLGALVSTRLLESLLFGVSALWPLAFVGPAVALLVAAALAALIPAARAGRLPPSEVLRAE